MTVTISKKIAGIISLVFMIFLGGAYYFEADKLPPGSVPNLDASFLPKALAVIFIALCLLSLAQSIFSHKDQGTLVFPDFWKVGVASVMTAVYLFAWQMLSDIDLWSGFSLYYVVTLIFMFAFFCLLTPKKKFNKKLMIIYASVSIIAVAALYLGFGLGMKIMF